MKTKCSAHSAMTWPYWLCTFIRMPFDTASAVINFRHSTETDTDICASVDCCCCGCYSGFRTRRVCRKGSSKTSDEYTNMCLMSNTYSSILKMLVGRLHRTIIEPNTHAYRRLYIHIYTHNMI